MTLPRRVLKGRAYMVQRRCSQRQFLLTPSDVVEQVFLYCLGLAAKRFAMDVFCIVVMGNHYHIGIIDKTGQMPRFMTLLNSLVARALNMHYKRGEAFWSPGSYSAVALGDADAILDKLVYMIVNPVAAGLVARPEDWPGVISLPRDLARREFVASRPKFFRKSTADPQGRDQDKRRRAPPREALPDSVTLRLVRPPGFEDHTDEQFRQLVQDRVQARIEEIHDERRREGRKGFLGRKAVLAQTPDEGPGKRSPSFRLNPRLSCKDKWRRIQMCEDLRAFWADHKEAATRYRAGEHNVLFPDGTYWYRIHFRARCRGPSAA